MLGTIKLSEYFGNFSRHQYERAEYHHKRELRSIADQPYSAASFALTVYHGFWLKCHELLNYWTLPPENRRALKASRKHMATPDTAGKEFWDEFDRTLRENRLRFREPHETGLIDKEAEK